LEGKNEMNLTIDTVSEELKKMFQNDEAWCDRSVVMRPSITNLSAVLKDIKSLFFPGYFSSRQDVDVRTSIRKISVQFIQEVQAGLCFSCRNKGDFQCNNSNYVSEQIVDKFLQALPKIRENLIADINATFLGDPAATGPDEVLYSYPGIKAMINHRIAHELYLLKTPIIPRIIAEIAHSETGIDIHPGATIAPGLFIDHGTGVVIGETTIIGKNVKIYQGVTLGAKSFPSDELGNPLKGIARHPIIEDNVTIYAEATILGRIVIGQGSVIGGNVCVTKPVPAGSKVLQGGSKKYFFTDGDGI
jgi:serine O-acetyltransferase